MNRKDSQGSRPSSSSKRRALLTTLVAASAVVLGASASRTRATADPRDAQGTLTPATAREEVNATYEIWERARVDVDRATLDALLAPDFKILQGGKETSRALFLDQVTQPGGAKLTRFDAEILTLQRTGNLWTAVITEKLEFEAPGADGKPQKVCNFWVTRDTCSRESGEWQFHSSEVIGVEGWPPGAKPPLRDW